jgi:transposase
MSVSFAFEAGGWIMSRAYSQDLRDRVIDAALKEALSARSAAARFGVGIATAIVWVRRARETGSRAARPRGQPRGSKLDAHREAILGWIAEKDDITIAEIRARLVVERGTSAGVGTVWTFLDRCGLTFKKRPRTPASRTGRRSPASAKRGSTDSPNSTRRA